MVNPLVLIAILFSSSSAEVCLGHDDNCCTPESPCDLGHGDCDSNADCKGDLICGENNCPSFGHFWNPGDDCCIQRCNGEDQDCCTPDTPCGRGEGDCDEDLDCKGDLICGHDNCPATGMQFDNGDDCCEKRIPVKVMYINSITQVFDPSASTEGCLTEDILVFKATVGTFIGGKSMVCGGKRMINDAGQLKEIFSRKCFAYDKTNKNWVNVIDMTIGRQYPGAVRISTDRWWISGGYYWGDEIVSRSTRTSELFNSRTNTFSRYISLPQPMAHHHMLKINSSHILLASTIDNFKVWTLDLRYRRWNVLLDNIPNGKKLFQAGIIQFPNGSKRLLISGGYMSNKTKLFDLDERTWTDGPDLPLLDLYGATCVPFGNTFFLVGGLAHSNENELSPLAHPYIYEFDVKEQKWNKFHRRFLIGSKQPDQYAAFLVPQNYC